MPSKSEALDILKADLTRSGLGSLLENLRALTVLLDSHGGLVGWNPAFDGLLQSFPPAASLQELLEKPEADGLQQSVENVLQTGTPIRMSLGLGSPAGGLAYDCLLVKQSGAHVLLIGEPASQASDTPADLPAVAGQLEQLKAQLNETKLALEIKHKEMAAVIAQTDEVAHTDALTLLPNRRSIIADLQRQVTYSERYGSPLSISMIDLDYFKAVNDNFGHAAGDQVLRFLASEMRDSMRKPDLIGRYGGDEFLVILQNTRLTAAAEQAARLCQQVRSTPIRAGSDEILVTLSIGIAQYKANEDDWRSLLERADQALYQAKHNGRGQWAILEA